MKRYSWFLLISWLMVINFACQKSQVDYPLKPVSYKEVDILDTFWSAKQERNHTVSLPYCFEHFGRGSFGNPRLIEAAAYILAKKNDVSLKAYVDKEIDRIVEVSQARIKNPEQAVHISGHFLEAAAAYYEATGKSKLLDEAKRIADLIDAGYGPGKKTYISGHEGLKIGLISLYRITGDSKYWRLAKFFLDERGKEDYPRQGEYALDRTYAQDHKPVIEQDEAVGHCVRATYLYIPLTDIAALTGEKKYRSAAEKIWEDMVSKKIYITGGIGSVRYQEKFGAPYELPNLSAWNETCAAYGNVVWNHRMFLLTGEPKYIDLMERVLYNAFLVGVSERGDRFFYQNPLKSFGHYERFATINVPCCPPNVVRLMASIGNYIYAQNKDSLYVNLFVASKAQIKMGKNYVNLEQETQYPWEGKIRLKINPEKSKRFKLYIRLPGWTQNQPMWGTLYRYTNTYEDKPTIKLNGQSLEIKLETGYFSLDRKWKKGDIVDINLPMPVRLVEAHPLVKENNGFVALERGPLAYCAEWPDNGGHALNIIIPDNATFTSEFRDDLFHGLVVVKGKVLALEREADGKLMTKPHELIAIPYYAWANRGMGEMAVWLARSEDKAWIKPVPPEPIKKVTFFGAIEKTYTGYNDQNDDICAVFDGREPLNSADESHLYFRMRPPQGEPAWIEYEFKEPTVISSSEVYFVDDRRFCRLPESWRILYKVGNQWKPVKNHDTYQVEKDRFNKVSFDPVKTKAIRLEVEPQKILYKAGQIGPPEALFLKEDIVWREFGVIEWRVK